MKIIIPIAILAVLLVVLAMVLGPGAAYIKSISTPVTPVQTMPPTPQAQVTEPLVVPTPQPTPTIDYLTYLQKGNDEVLAGKESVTEGRTIMMKALATQGSTYYVRPVLDQAAANFTDAKQHFNQAITDYDLAKSTAPSGMQETLTTMTNTLQGCVRASDSLLTSANQAKGGDWFSSNELFNKASSSYDVSLSTVNPYLVVLGVSS
jgi:hypothetical protein